MIGGVSGCLREPRSGQTLDANAIVIDPQVPADIRGKLAQAQRRRLAAFSAPPPDVVPARRRRREHVLTPQGRRAVITAVTMAAFLAATIASWVFAAVAHQQGLIVIGFLAFFVWLTRFIATGSAVDAARAAGWRKPRATADPSHPEWDGLHAV